jgi:two-component system CheB/CheR fusion protein
MLFGLRNAIDESRARGAPVRKERLRFAANGKVRFLNIDVTPLGTGSHRHYLILFEEPGADGEGRKGAGPAKGKGKGARKSGDQPTGPAAVVRQLETELEASRQYMQSIIHDLEAANEELQSANEEILSSNEELQSTNEELDTAKEELQSSNEELSTLNEELHGRNEELSRANSDLLNLLASVQIPIVIVTSDLRIRRFTPAAEKLLNLIPADLGRPIGHIKPNIHCPDLEAMISEVIETVTIREREVQDGDGLTYTLRVRPYKNTENRIDGALLVLFDISAARSHASELRAARESAAAVVSLVQDPILLLSGDLRVQKANRPYLESFQAVGPDTEGRFLYDLDEGQWDQPALRQALEGLPREKSFQGLVLEHRFPRAGQRTLSLDGRYIEGIRPDDHAVVLVIRDADARAG